MDKPKFNILDGIIILILVMVFAAGIYILGDTGSNSSNAESQNTTVEFTIQLTKSQKSLYDKFLAAKESGETVWVGVKERFEATISDVVATPAQRIITNQQTKELTLAEDPTTLDISVTMTASGVETPASISASGTALRVGVEEAIHGKGIAGYGFITSLKTIAQ